MAIDSSSILRTLNEMLESDERKHQTEIEASLAGMRLAVDRQQMAIENVREERRLELAEGEFFEGQVVGLRADLETEVNKHLNVLYNTYFKADFDDIFNNKKERYGADKYRKDWIKVFNEKGAGFNDADSELMAMNILAYVEGGFTNHESMRRVANLFQDRDRIDYDKEFRDAAQKFGIFSSDPSSYRHAVENFNMVFEIDNARDKLRQERMDIAKGDTEYDYTYEGLFHGEKLKKKEGGKEIDLTPATTLLENLVKDLEGVEENSETYNLVMQKYLQGKGFEHFGVDYIEGTGKWVAKDSFRYDVTKDPKLTYAQLVGDGATRGEGAGDLNVNRLELVNTMQSLSELRTNMNNKDQGHQDGLYIYSKEERSRDKLAYVSLKQLSKITSENIKLAEKVKSNIETKHPRMVDDYQGEVSRTRIIQDDLGPGPRPPNIWHVPEYLQKESARIGTKLGLQAAPAIKDFAADVWDIFKPATEEELKLYHGDNYRERVSSEDEDEYFDAQTYYNKQQQEAAISTLDLLTQ